MAMTVSSSVDYDQTAWELRAYFALRPEMYFDAVADIKPTRESMNGAAVKFVIQNDLAVQSTSLNESTDVTPLVMSDSTITLTLAEYGAAVQTSALLRGTSFLPLDPVVANVVGYNAGISLDELARLQLQAGTNVAYSGQGTGTGARNQTIPTDLVVGTDIMYVNAKLRGSNVPTIGGLYTGFIHPDVSYDLRNQTGGSNWRDPHVYSQPGEIWVGEIGAFQGTRFIETPRAPLWADAGSSTTNTDVYGTIICGRQALAKTYSSADGNGPMPRVAPGPITDILRRFVPVGWYWLGQYGIFRQASVWRIESASSIGNNSGTGGSN
jgi:N4-gp56 family major capsid protein